MNAHRNGTAPKPTLPSLGRMAAGFAAQTVKHLAAGSPEVDQAEYDRRLAACEKCRFRTATWRCGNLPGDDRGCGCFVKVAAHQADKDCPRGYWPGHQGALSVAGDAEIEALIDEVQLVRPNLVREAYRAVLNPRSPEYKEDFADTVRAFVERLRAQRAQAEAFNPPPIEARPGPGPVHQVRARGLPRQPAGPVRPQVAGLRRVPLQDPRTPEAYRLALRCEHARPASCGCGARRDCVRPDLAAADVDITKCIACKLKDLNVEKNP